MLGHLLLHIRGSSEVPEGRPAQLTKRATREAAVGTDPTKDQVLVLEVVLALAVAKLTLGHSMHITSFQVLYYQRPDGARRCHVGRMRAALSIAVSTEGLHVVISGALDEANDASLPCP
jgi:hypothetical protein